MRPPKYKTPLSVLRHMLTVKDESRRDRKGRAISRRVPLTPKRVAEWLDCSVGLVNGLETGRKNLTPAHVYAIVQQTAVSSDWLTGGNPKASPLDWYREPYTQETFDRRQAEVEREKGDRKFCAHAATEGVARLSSKLAAVLMLAMQKGKTKPCEAKLDEVLNDLFFSLDPNMLDRAGLVGSFRRGRHTLTRPDLAPTLDAWQAALERELLKAKGLKR